VLRRSGTGDRQPTTDGDLKVGSAKSGSCSPWLVDDGELGSARGGWMLSARSRNHWILIRYWRWTTKSCAQESYLQARSIPRSQLGRCREFHQLFLPLNSSAPISNRPDEPPRPAWHDLRVESFDPTFESGAAILWNLKMPEQEHGEPV
jgi:hypothetical protein